MMRMSLLRPAAGVGALALVLVLAACGADPAPTSTPVPPRAVATPVPTATPAPRPATATPAPRPTPTPEPALPAGPVLPASIVDVHGNEVVVEDISRIVVMNGDFTEVVYALGLGENVVAVDTSATYPSEATELPQVGYQRRLSAEGVLSMDPTVVIGNTHAGPPEVLEQIRATGVPVVVLEVVTTVDGGARKIRRIAQALGVPARGEALALELETQISDDPGTFGPGAGTANRCVPLHARARHAFPGRRGTPEPRAV